MLRTALLVNFLAKKHKTNTAFEAKFLPSSNNFVCCNEPLWCSTCQTLFCTSVPTHKSFVMAAEGIFGANTRPLLALMVPRLKPSCISHQTASTGMLYIEARGCAVVLLQEMLYCSCDWNRVSIFKVIGRGSGIASWTDQFWPMLESVCSK